MTTNIVGVWRQHPYKTKPDERMSPAGKSHEGKPNTTWKKGLNMGP